MLGSIGVSCLMSSVKGYMTAAVLRATATASVATAATAAAVTDHWKFSFCIHPFD